jgi:hypothetical protein
VDGYRDKNIFLAGDASHLFSPIGGLGMNTGIQDAFNLAWKLVGVMHQDLNSAILDTYEMERLEISRNLISSTDITTRLITRIDNDSNGAIKHWLPIMENRKLIKKDLPLSFSGLGQKYQNNQFIKDLQPSATNPEYSLVGGQIPYATAKDKNHHEVTSYELIRDYKPTVLIFDDEAGSLAGINKILNNYPCWICVVRNQSFSLNSKDYEILDSNQSFHKKFYAKGGEVFLIRPDGYIGCQAHLNSLYEFEQFLNNFFRR